MICKDSGQKKTGHLTSKGTTSTVLIQPRIPEDDGEGLQRSVGE